MKPERIQPSGAAPPTVETNPLAYEDPAYEPITPSPNESDPRPVWTSTEPVVEEVGP